MTGCVISHYEIQERLGGGGMGIVYRARDTNLDRLVALKFLPPELVTDEEANRRFMLEAKSASSLDHPNICTIYEVSEVSEESEMKGRLFISMAFYDGITLKEYLNEVDRIKPAEAVDLAGQMAEGLAAAHKRGIIHRDIKPANIMITQEGLVKILDFGLAKLAGGIALTKSGSTLGTAGYMAPEQVRAEVVDHRADLWSLGVVLFQMLTGRLPFSGDYEQAIAYSILNDEPEISGDFSEKLGAVVERLLEKEPAKRFGAATDVVRVLEGVPEANPAQAPDAAVTGRSGYRMAFMVAAILVAVILGWFLLRPASPVDDKHIDPEAIAVMPFTVRGDPNLEYLGEGLVDLLSVKLDGAGTIHSIDANAVLGTMAKEDLAIETPADALLLARRFGAGRTIIGNVVRIGHEIRLSASLYEDEVEATVSASTTAASEDELTATVDELARKIVGHLLEDPADELESLAALTTRSFPALKNYLRGEQAVRQRKWDEAVAALKSAVEEDSTFALAWSRLGYAAGWLVDVNLESRALDEALARRQSLPDRMQKLVEADYYAFRDGDVERALDLYRQVLSRTPNDVYALQKVGEILYHYNPLLARSQAPAWEYFVRALELAPDRGDNLRHLFDLAGEEHRYDLVDSLMNVASARDPDRPRPLMADYLYGLLHRAQGDSSWRFDDIGDLSSGAVRVLYLIAATEAEDLTVARQLAEASIREERFHEEFRLHAAFRLSPVAAAQGRLRDQERASRDAGPEFVAESIISRVLLYATPSYPASDSLLHALRTEVADWDTLSYRLMPYEDDRPVFEGDYHLIQTYLLALLDFRMGDYEGFELKRGYLSDRADPSVEPEPDRRPRRGHGPHLAYAFLRTLDALTYWDDGRVDAALRAIDDARLRVLWRSPTLSILYEQVLRRYVLGELLFASERYEEAREAFRSLTAADYDGGLYYLGPSYRRLAEIHERLGDEEKAMEYYARLLRLWKNCDPELVPVREDVRKNLDRLLTESVREPPA